MNKNDKLHKFRNDKNKTMDLIDSLKDILADCVYTGMLDYESSIYNELNDLIDEADASESYIELSEIIHRAKQIEHNLESWLSNYGKYTQDLDWPEILENK